MSGGIFLTQFYGAKDEKGMQQAFRFKLIDLVKVMIFHFWLKKERWLRNLTAEA